MPGFAGSPPLRDKKDQDALWDGIAKGTIHTVGTDHGARSREEKLDPTLNGITRREGVSNVQVYRPMLDSEGVRAALRPPSRFSSDSVEYWGT